MENIEQVAPWNVDTIVLIVVCVSILVAVVCAAGWKRANQRTIDLRNEFAAKRALLADANDRLLMEEQTSTQLNDDLARAEKNVAAAEFELNAHRQKIESLNRENDAIYENYLALQKELRVSGVGLMYRQYLAKRIFHTSRWYLEKINPLLKSALKDVVKDERSPNRASILNTIEPVALTLELLELADTDNVTQRIREMRADGTRAVVHLLPRLRDFLADWERRLGRRLETKVALTDKSVLFSGSWVHLELILATMLDNAVKHSVESTPIMFAFHSANQIATFEVTNWSAAPVPESIDRAKHEMMMGDPERPRFGLYLMDQLANGYRAIVKLENKGMAPDGSSHVVRTTFLFSLR